MPLKAPYVAAAAVTVGVLGGAYYTYKAYHEMRPTKLPEQWTTVGRLKSVEIFPIKSCGGIVMQQAECTALGLKDGWLRDRVLMVVDKNNNFITARIYPELVLVNTSLKNSMLSLDSSNMETVNIDLAKVVASKKVIKAQVWGVTVPVYDCGSTASEWFSRLLDKSSDHFRLVYYASQKSRKLKLTPSEAKVFKFKKEDVGAFPDDTPYHLINESSVEDLNSRISDCEVTSRHFRPNFLLTGAKPYVEDNWDFIKIGDNIFEIVRPCTRCMLVVIDPETGIRSSKAEPVETLKTYRQATDPEMRKAVGTAPRMGVQMALRTGNGIVSTNDVVYAA